MAREAQFAVVIAAAGYGSFRPGVPKIVESVADGAHRPMIAEVVRTARQAGAAPIVAVVNPQFEKAVRETLSRCGESGVWFCSQPERRGAAEAVARAEEILPEGAGAFLTIFADMPLWRPETIRDLMAAHRRERPAISMVSISIADAAHPRVLERYGRILRNKEGEIIGVVEPGDATELQLQATATVNPSLYVFDRAFFRAHVRDIPARERGDGFPAEQYLPPLVAIAAAVGARIIEVPLHDRREALGVNTVAELEEVRRVVAERRRADAVAVST